MIPAMAGNHVAKRLILLAEQLEREEGTRGKAAHRMGIGETVLSKFKPDSDRGPSVETVLAIVRTMRLSPSWFFDESLPDDADYHDHLLGRSAPPGELTAATDPDTARSLEDFHATSGLTDEQLSAARRARFGWTPVADDWEIWLGLWKRAKREGRTDISERDVSLTAQRLASAARKRPRH